MVIDIIGGGSLGLLHAARLSEVRHPVNRGKDGFQGIRLWTRTKEQARFIRNEGLRLIQEGRADVHIHNVNVYALHEAGEVFSQTGAQVSCVLLFVKQTHIDSTLIHSLKLFPYKEGTPLLCYQNGIGHMEALQEAWPRHNLVWALTTEAARRLHDNEVVHMGYGSTWLGVTNVADRLANRGMFTKMLCGFVKKVLEQAGFQVFWSNNIEDRVYQKLLLNVIINPLTAVLRVNNGQLLSGEARLTLMKNLFQEAVAVYRAAQIAIDEERDWEQIVDVCRRTAANMSSMRQDIEAGRQTECEAITGALIRLAERYEVAIPLHRMMYHLILASCESNPVKPRALLEQKP